MASTALTPHFARTINGTNTFDLQALTNVCLAQISVAVLADLRYSVSDIRVFGQKVVEHELLTALHHDLSFRTLRPKNG